MLRAAVGVVAISVVATACALVGPPPPPPHTRLLVVEVQNGFGQPAQLAVAAVQGAVEPATVPPRSTMLVNVFVPKFGSDWTIVVNGEGLVTGADHDFRFPELRPGDIVIGIDPDGAAFWRCTCL